VTISTTGRKGNPLTTDARVILVSDEHEEAARREGNCEFPFFLDGGAPETLKITSIQHVGQARWRASSQAATQGAESNCGTGSMVQLHPLTLRGTPRMDDDAAGRRFRGAPEAHSKQSDWRVGIFRFPHGEKQVHTSRLQWRPAETAARLRRPRVQVVSIVQITKVEILKPRGVCHFPVSRDLRRSANDQYLTASGYLLDGAGIRSISIRYRLIFRTTRSEFFTK